MGKGSKGLAGINLAQKAARDKRHGVRSTMKSAFTNRYLVATLALATGWAGFGLTASKGDIIPADRRIVWAPGIPGGIPNYTTIVNVKNAPYNAKADGVTDDTAAIQAALTSATSSQVVYLPAGTYLVTNMLRLSTSYVAIRGDGPDKTKILSSAPATLLDFDWGSDWGADWIAINSGFTKGSTNITVADASSLAVGSYILVTQSNNPSMVINGDQWNSGPANWCGFGSNGEHVQTQFVFITAKDGNTLTLNRPLYWDLDASLSPVVRHMGMTIQYSGVEDLYIEGTATNRDGASGNIFLYEAAYCWVKNCVSKMAGGAHIYLRLCYGCQIEHNYVNDAYDHGSGRDYGLFNLQPNSDHLFVDNIVNNARHSLIFEGGGSGCVYAYNCAVNVWSSPDPTWLSGDMDTHGPHPFMNLFEGNIFGKLSHDNSNGSASDNTTFRCWIRNTTGHTNANLVGARDAVDIQAVNYSNSVIGCVIGQPGDNTNGMVQFALPGVWTGEYCSYRFGGPQPGGDNTLPDYTNVLTTTYLHGNFDYVSGSNIWNAGNADHTIPASLYLTNKPAWFGKLPWPPFDPNNPSAASVTNIPAGYRYTYGVDPPSPKRIIVIQWPNP